MNNLSKKVLFILCIAITLVSFFINEQVIQYNLDNVLKIEISPLYRLSAMQSQIDKDNIFETNPDYTSQDYLSWLKEHPVVSKIHIDGGNDYDEALNILNYRSALEVRYFTYLFLLPLLFIILIIGILFAKKAPNTLFIYIYSIINFASILIVNHFIILRPVYKGIIVLLIALILHNLYRLREDNKNAENLIQMDIDEKTLRERYKL